MLEINDELMTPGCPQCAIKHLSAALYHHARTAHIVTSAPDPYMVCVCTAYINLVEVRAGYLSHLWYAVGALVRAEEWMAPRMVGECVARKARLLLEEGGVEALIDALSVLAVETAPDHADWATAHFGEAVRELPDYADAMSMDDLVGSIERIRDDFFTAMKEAPAASAEGEGKGGDETMATKAKKPAFLAKGAAKKPDPKAAKAACKGGKCKKGCK